MTAGDALAGREALERLADAALSTGGAETGIAHVEVLVNREAGGLTRFANSRIHQNVWREDVAARVRVVTDDGRVGVAGGSADDPAAVAQTARRAAAIARVSPTDPDFPGLAPAADVASVRADEATVAASPQDRAAAVRAVLAEVPGDCEAAGAYATEAAEQGVFTTAGQRAYAPLSSASLTLVVTGDSSSGWAEQGGRATGDIDPAGAARSAVAKVRAGRDPVDLDPGSWPVVLEPAAVGTLVQFLSFLGFGGRAWLEGRTFTAGRLGEQAVDPAVSIADDALSDLAVGFAVDAEGTPKQRVELIRDGVLAGVVHDRHTARKAGVDSTGHALPAPNRSGPLALTAVLAPGDGGTIDDLVAGCERGLLVTRFHYTNTVHPMETTITGMTRDGTFLISEGRITAAVRNLRFTQSIVAALASVEAVGTETGWSSGWYGGSRYPGLRLPAFMFSGTTSFG